MLEGGVTVGSLLVESTTLNGKSYTITHTVVTKGTLKVDFVFGRVDMPGNVKFANFTNLYFNKNTSNPDTSKFWAKVDAQEYGATSGTADACFWYTSNNGNKTSLTISPYARFSIGDPDYDVGRLSSEEPTVTSSTYISVGDTVYAGDTLCNNFDDEEYIVPERDSDDFY